MATRLAAVGLCLLLAACLVSEQDGSLLPQGNPRYTTGQGLGDVTFHFDSTFNKAFVAGRTALLLLLGVWLFRVGGIVPRVIAVGALVACLVPLPGDVAAISRYRIEVGKAGMSLRIPPDVDRDIRWDQLDRLEVEGTTYQRAATWPGGPGGGLPTLPDWEKMTLTVGGDTIVVDLSRLSMEQRQTVWTAIAGHGRMVSEE